MTLTFWFVYCFLFVNYYSKILLQLCQLYSTGHFIAEVTLYQMLELVKIPTRRPWKCLIINKLLTLFGKECKGSTELVNEYYKLIKSMKLRGGRGVLLLASQ